MTPKSTEPRAPVIVEQDADWVRVRLGAESTTLKPSEAAALAYELFGVAKDTTEERWARLAEGATYD